MYSLNWLLITMYMFCLLQYVTHSRRKVLGIESSCDDTAAAIVDEDGNVLGETIFSQTELHVE